VAFGADHTDTNFAWGVYGGLAHDVTPSVTMDLSYRVKSGKVTTYQGDFAYNGLEINHITSDARRPLEIWLLRPGADAGGIQIKSHPPKDC
jgi:hypothetical protein